ncbi:MAG: flagellar basal body P-ring protein FlgI [Phycisphaerae bacterium]|nr:flagellar basal body P-ring protein FlgI [Phycisphaerae bacterium]
MRRGMILFVLVLVIAGLARAERVKDIVTVKGERGNPLYGYGLVIGLNGTGDNSNVTKRAVASVLRRMNITFNAADIDAANVASVFVTAELGPFDRVGQKIDINVATIGSSSSLQGGTLLMTSLIAADGRTYAVGQGSVVLGGFGASGADASVTSGHLTAGSIPNGATVEREELANVVEKGEITLLLKNPDHSTAERIAKQANTIAKGIAHAADAGTIRIKVPKTVTKKKVNAFIEKIGLLSVKVDQPARVVINERTGTIIVGQNVSISTTGITHGNLTITTEEKEYISQPTGNFGDGGTTERYNRTSLKVVEKKVNMHIVPKTLTVTQLAEALNAMGLTPRDMIAIFVALKKAGALQADLVIQ